MVELLVGHGDRFRAEVRGRTDAPGWEVIEVGATIIGHRPPALPGSAGIFQSSDGAFAGVIAGRIFDWDIEGAPSPGRKAGRGDRGPGDALKRAWQRHGPDLLRLLDGAFVLVLVTGNDFLVARDAIGERPVAILERDGDLLVSDQLSALIQSPSCDRRLDPGGAADFLATGFCPFSRTPVAGIRKLRPGTGWHRRGGVARELEYHRIGDGAISVDSDEHVSTIRERLVSAVARRRVTDAPTGLLLSGGLDSSLVGGLLGGEALVAAYSLTFGDRYRNELEFSGLMARHLGIPHRVVRVTPSMIEEGFPETARILDEPIGDPLTVPNIIVAREAATEVRVVFNGEGGDPVFGGPKNLPLLAFETFRGARPDLSPEALYIMSYNKGSQLLDDLLRPDLREAMAAAPSPAELLAPFLRDPGLTDPLSRLMHVNLRLKGAGQILPKVYRAAVAAGVEVASPLFDRDLVEAAFRVPGALKLRGAVEKWVLKEAVRDVVPAEIIARPKSGMLVPVHFWFRRELRAFARDSLLSRDSRVRGMLEKKALENLLAFRGGGVRGYHGDRIWLLLSLEHWMRVHGVAWR